MGGGSVGGGIGSRGMIAPPTRMSEGSAGGVPPGIGRLGFAGGGPGPASVDEGAPTFGGGIMPPTPMPPTPAPSPGGAIGMSSPYQPVPSSAPPAAIGGASPSASAEQAILARFGQKPMPPRPMNTGMVDAGYGTGPLNAQGFQQAPGTQPAPRPMNPIATQASSAGMSQRKPGPDGVAQSVGTKNPGVPGVAQRKPQPQPRVAPSPKA